MYCARCGAPATYKVEAVRDPLSFDAVELDVCEECFYSWHPSIDSKGGIRWTRRRAVSRKLLFIAISSSRLARLVERFARTWVGRLLSSCPFYWIGVLAFPILPALLFYNIALHFLNPAPILEWRSVTAGRPGLGTLIPLIDPLTISLNFWIAYLVAVVVHELAHVVVAVRAGVRPASISLLLLGPIPFGVSVEVPRLIRSARIYAAGPAANIALAGLLALVMALSGRAQLAILPPEILALLGIPVEAPPPLPTISWMAFINLWVAGILNASPLFPALDGQGMLSSYLWSRFGRRGARLGFYISLAFGIATVALIVAQSLPARL